MRQTKRMSQMPASGTLKMLETAKQMEKEGKTIIHMEVGEPDFDTPEHIKRAAKEALERGLTKYTPSLGMPELREAIADHLNTKGIGATPNEIIVTPGAKHAIFCAIISALDPGDEIIIPSPCWTYEGIALIAGAKVEYVETRPENGFRVEIEKVKEKLSPKTRMLLLNYPNNPTGAVIGKNEIKALADLAVDHDLWVISDEIYDCLVYDGEHVSIASLPNMKDRTIYINGFSKAYAMTGWRLGYAFAPKELIKEMSKVQQASTSCVAQFIQFAGVAALRGPQDFVLKMKEEYRRRRDAIVDGLNSIDGFNCNKPSGAFYVFPSIAFGVSSAKLCERMLVEARVAAVPGSEFGPYGEGHVRFSYATSMQNIEKAIEKLRKFAESFKK